jgi:hypothetical protein
MSTDTASIQRGPGPAPLRAVARVEDRPLRELEQERALADAEPHLGAELLEVACGPVHLSIVPSTAG